MAGGFQIRDENPRSREGPLAKSVGIHRRFVSNACALTFIERFSMCSNRLFLRAFLIVFLLCATDAVQAASFTWTNTVGGFWTNATNWNPNGVPGAGDTALIVTP